MNFTTVSNQMGGNNSKLKIFRELHNYTVKYIAEDILNIKVAAYQKLEQQPSKLTGEQADKLALLYKISITELLAMDTPIVTFSNNTIDKAYIHNHYEFEKEILENMIASRDKEIEHLKTQLNFFQNQNQQLLLLLEKSKLP